MPVSPEIKQLLEQQPLDIPVFHSVALKLTVMIPDPFCEIDDIVRVINEDQALSAQVLKMANSSAYMGLVKAETIKASALRLGMRQITALAMTASQQSLHISNNAVVSGVMNELWGHSMACASGAWWVAQNTGHHGILDHAYLAGLLHDIGKLYLLKSVEKLLNNKEINVPVDRQLLIDIFSEMHVEQGCRLMDHWNIPPIYHSVVENHHTEKYDRVDSLLTVVRFVNAASRNISMSLNPEEAQNSMSIPEAEILGMDEIKCQKMESVMASSIT